MAKIKIKLFLTLQKNISSDNNIVEASTMIEAVKELIKKYPLLKRELVNKDFTLKDDYIYLVNGRNIAFLQGENTTLKDGDRITIFPPIGGG
ncbi:MAG: MoaD family protein [Petrotogales bacterium]